MTLNNNRAGHAVRVAVLSALAIFAAPISSAHAEKIQLDVAAGEAPDALKEFIRQTGLQLIFDFDSIAAFKTHAVSGQYDAAEALTRMLSNTGLAFEFVNERTVTVTRKEAITQRPKVIPTKVSYERDASATSEVERIRLAQTVEAAASSHETTALDSASKEDISERRIQLEEVIVTGSHIRGAASASPVEVYNRADIEKFGVGTVQDFVRRLPSNFNGAVAESNILSPNYEAAQNSSKGSAINLRGLGSGSTLVLLNGQRLAPSNLGLNVDVTLIPLSAIEKVEVVTDGASAIYGSDAIGGVVNFILKETLDGAETNLRYGDSAGGGAQEIQASQSVGKSWGAGSVFLTYEYRQRDRLSSMQRDFSVDALYPADFLPGENAQSAFLSARQNLAGGRIELFGNGLYSTRTVEQSIYKNPQRPHTNDTDTRAESDQYLMSLGARMALGNSWEGRVAGSTSRHTLDSNTRYNSQGFVQATKSQYDASMGTAQADGAVLALPGGDLRLALGAQWQRERLEQRRGSLDRDLHAIFAEVRVPVIGTSNAVTVARHLELSLAARRESYSDFGTSTNPMVGLLWSPVNGLNVRGTFGSSFKAPQLLAADLSNNAVALMDWPDVQGSDGISRTAFLIGNDPDLREETSDTWTVGLDLHPMSWPGFSLSATYFDVEFESRIAFPPNAGGLDMLNDSRAVDFIARRTSMSSEAFDSTISQILTAPPPAGFIGCALPVDSVTGSCLEDPRVFDVVADIRQTNIAATRVRGIDVNAGYETSNAFGAWDALIAISYLLSFEEQATAAAPKLDLVDTYLNPVDLRGRASLTWGYGGLGVTGTINYVDSYVDTRFSPTSQIDSWLTLDLQLSYAFGEHSRSELLKGTKIVLSFLNLNDKQPPTVLDSIGYRFDLGNADALGRFVSLRLAKQW